MPKPKSTAPRHDLPIRLAPRTLTDAQLRRLSEAAVARGEPALPTRREAEEWLDRLGEQLRARIDDYNGTKAVPPGARVLPYPGRPKGPGRTILLPETPLDEAVIETLVAHPDERVPLLWLREFSRGRELLPLWQAAAKGEEPAQATSHYHPSHARVLATIWPRLVERARADAEREGVELTSLGDALVGTWEAAGRRRNGPGSEREPFAPGLDAPPTLDRLAAAVAELDDEAVVMALLRSRSRHVRTTVVAHARALQRPEVVLGLLNRIDSEQARSLLANPALGAEARTAARNWAVTQALQGTLWGTSLAVLDGLDDAGVPLGQEMMGLLRVAAQTTGAHAVRTALARIAWVARDAEMRALLLRDVRTRTTVAAELAERLRGEPWWQMVQLLLHAGDERALVPLLARATEETVEGLPPRSLAPLLAHGRTEVREAALRLARATERGAEAPEPLPEPVRPRRVRI